MKAPRVKNLMTPFPYAIDLNSPLSQARDMMREHGVRHLPVTKDKTLCGIVTDRDLKALLGPAIGVPDIVDLRVQDAYVEDCYSTDLNTPLIEVLNSMAEQHIGAAIVTSKGRLAGIFTTTDACREFAKHLERQFPAPGPDEAA